MTVARSKKPRSVLTAFEGALEAIAAEERDLLGKGLELPAETVATQARLQKVLDALLTIRAHILEVGISFDWFQGILVNNAVADLTAAAATLEEELPLTLALDDPAVDVYFPAGMQGVRSAMSVDALLAVAQRLRVVSVVSEQVVSVLDQLKDGIVALTGRDGRTTAAATTIDAVPDASFVSDLLSHIQASLVQLGRGDRVRAEEAGVQTLKACVN